MDGQSLNALSEQVIGACIEGRLVVELKAAKVPANLLKAQLMTYLKLMDLPLALGINFNHERLVDGVTRVMNGYPDLP